jgi:hypothetical protein
VNLGVATAGVTGSSQPEFAVWCRPERSAPGLFGDVGRFTILEQEPILNNVLRGFKALRVAVN